MVKSQTYSLVFTFDYGTVEYSLSTIRLYDIQYISKIVINNGQ